MFFSGWTYSVPTPPGSVPGRLWVPVTGSMIPSFISFQAVRLGQNRPGIGTYMTLLLGVCDPLSPIKSSQNSIASLFAICLPSPGAFSVPNLHTAFS